MDKFKLAALKQPRNDAYTWTTHVGGRGQTQRSLTVAEVFQRIQSGREGIYVERPTGERVDVIVATSRFGNKYIKTTADGHEPKNLLSLPECP